jgi:cytochrome c556
VVFAAAVLTGPITAVHGEDENLAILDRQLIMQQLETDAEALGEIAAGSLAPDSMVERARSLAKGAKEARDSFKENVAGGAAKADVWKNLADFAKRMDEFVANTEKLAKVSEGGDVTAMKELLVDAMPCKQCHDIYRVPKSRS